MRKLVILILLISGSLVPSFSQEGSDKKGQMIEWTAVTGAAYYQLKVYQEETLVADVEVSEPRYRLFLEPGEYRYNITVFNKFKKRVGESPFYTLSVLPVFQPAILDFSPKSLYTNFPEDQELILEVHNLREGADIFLTMNSLRVKGDWVAHPNNPDQYICHFPKESVAVPGVWNLTVVNPSGSEDSLSSALLMKPVITPYITDFPLTLAETNTTLQEISIYGSGFEEGMEILCLGPGRQAPFSVRVISEEELLVHFYFEEWEPGDYTIIPINPSGAYSFYPSVLSIYDAGDIPEEKVVEENSEEETEIKKPGWHNKMTGIGVGYHLSFMNGGQGEFFPRSFAGWDVRFRFGFGASFFSSIPFVSRLGFEGSLSYSLFPVDETYGQYSFHSWNFDTALFYKTPFEFPINGIVRAGVGLALTSVTGYGKVGEMNWTSLDFEVLVGGAVEFQFWNRFYLETGCNFRWLFGVRDTVFYSEPYAVIGVYFK